MADANVDTGFHSMLLDAMEQKLEDKNAGDAAQEENKSEETTKKAAEKPKKPSKPLTSEVLNPLPAGKMAKLAEVTEDDQDKVYYDGPAPQLSDPDKTLDYGHYPNAEISDCTYVHSFPRELMSQYIDVDDCSYCSIRESHQFYHLIIRNCGSFATQSYEFVVQSSMLPDQLFRPDSFHFMKDDVGVENRGGKRATSKRQCKVLLGMGVHAINFEKEEFIILHHALGKPKPGNGGLPSMYREVVLFTKGKKQWRKLKKFCMTLLEKDEASHDKVVSIYRWVSSRGLGGGFWKKSCMKMARPMDSVVLPEKLKKTLIDDLHMFLSETTDRFYFNHGIPYKRSYLFHGSPGSGKSSFIMAIAGTFKRNLCLMQPATPNMTDQTFSSCVSSCPKDSIIVLEDIDALFDIHRNSKKETHLTFSGILNSLDGIASPTAQIFILTTNYPDKLDPALIRSGRVDMHLHFPKASEEQLIKIFKNFYPEAEEGFAEKFAKNVLQSFSNHGVSMAAIQQHFIRNMCAPAKDALNIDNLKKQVTNSREAKASEDRGNMFL